MATIKFISEQECYLYIDTECMGILEVSKLKKLELEVGSYLIEVKDMHGKTIKKYTLDVEEKQNQILQLISLETENIVDILDKIKNDPTVRFFNQRRTFKYKGKFGYINSQFDIVIDAKYSEAEEFLRKKTIVKRYFSDQEKVTIIDTDGNMCYERWFDYIGEDETTVLLRNDNIYFTINKLDYSIISEYEGVNYNQVDKYIPASRMYGIDKMFGYIDKSGKEVIPFIYDNVKNFKNSGFAEVMRFGHVRAIDREGNLYTSLGEALKDGKEAIRKVTHRISSDSDYQAEEEKYIYKALKLSCEESKFRDFDGNWWEDVPIKEGNNWGLWRNEPFEEEFVQRSITSYKCDRIFYYVANEYFAYRVGNECKVLNINNPDEVYSYKYNGVIPVVLWEHTFDTMQLASIIVQEKGKYGIADISGKLLVPIEYDMIEVTGAFDEEISGKIGIIWKNSKCTLVNLETGQILDKFRFDEIVVNVHPIKWFLTEATFMVRVNGKYGCINLRSEDIVPAKYDSIDFKYDELVDGYHYIMILHLNNKVEAYEYRKHIPSNSQERVSDYEFFTNEEFDECVFLKNNNSNYRQLSFIGVRKGVKWGILDATPPWVKYRYGYSEPNLKQLEFKYNSLEALLIDTGELFKRGYKINLGEIKLVPYVFYENI